MLHLPSQHRLPPEPDPPELPQTVTFSRLYMSARFVFLGTRFRVPKLWHTTLQVVASHTPVLPNCRLHRPNTFRNFWYAPSWYPSVVVPHPLPSLTVHPCRPRSGTVSSSVHGYPLTRLTWSSIYLHVGTTWRRFKSVVGVEVRVRSDLYHVLLDWPVPVEGTGSTYKGSTPSLTCRLSPRHKVFFSYFVPVWFSPSSSWNEFSQ